MTSFINVETDPALLLVRGPAAASANSEKLNAALRDSSLNKPFFFPAGDWYFGEDTVNLNVNGTCISTLAHSGQMFLGSGSYKVNNEGASTEDYNVRIIYAGPRLSLANLTHSVNNAPWDTITINTSGYTVKDQDVGAIVNITGGANAILDDTVTNYGSFYTITSVNTTNNSWTLDRACTNGSSTDLVGTMTYRLWTDNGYGNVYSGLAFKGHANYQSSPRCHVGFHSNVTAGFINTGKHKFDMCSWSTFTACVLAGKNMTKAYSRASTYDGATESYCDHLTFQSCNCQEARTFLYMRTEQSVNHAIRDSIHMANISDSVVYAERGGEVLIDNMTIGGTRGHVLRIGQPTSVNGSFVVRRVGHDASPNSAVPKLLLKDQGAGVATTAWYDVTFDDVQIDGNLDPWSSPIVSVYSAGRVSLRRIHRLRPGSILMEKGGTSGSLYQPSVVVEHSYLDGFSSPSELKNSSSSSPYGRLTWRDCRNFSNATQWPDGSIPASISVGTAALTVTEAHAGRMITLDYTSGTSTITLPAATGTFNKYTFIVTSANTTNHIIEVLNSSHTFCGSVSILDNSSNTETAYAARAEDGDDTITLNGTSSVGQIGDWVELTDIAANKWAVRGQLVVPSGGDIADPFSATV